MDKRVKHRLAVTNLGPIREAVIDFRPLTVFIGEQASGKSLLMQLFCFFRSLRTEIALRYKPADFNDQDWPSRLAGRILNELRGVPFHLFADRTGRAELTTLNPDGEAEEGDIRAFKVSEKNSALELNDYLEARMVNWLAEIMQSDENMAAARKINHLFIPTDRSIYTRFWANDPGVLFAEYQPYLLRRYTHILNEARKIYTEAKLYDRRLDQPLSKITRDMWNRQVEALNGMVSTNPLNDSLWEWLIRQGNNDYKRVSLSGVSSGQMEAWPFFAIAATVVAERDKAVLYFEEPETHLHPRAQRVIMEAIAFLVEQGREVTITTHSPYLLYALNNMLLAGQIREKGSAAAEKLARENLQPLTPADVAVYRLQNGRTSDIIDPQTGLVESEELDAIADKLGDEFETALDLLHTS